MSRTTLLRGTVRFLERLPTVSIVVPFFGSTEYKLGSYKVYISPKRNYNGDNR